MKILPAIHFWSATPTPLTADHRVDIASVSRMVDDAIVSKIGGLFLAGTCGEGSWLPNREKRQLIKSTAIAANGRLQIAVQVSDNSVPRILDNIHEAAEAGANYAVLAPPATMMNATPERITALFEEAVAASPLPVGIYDLGKHRAFSIPIDQLRRIYLLPKVKFVKDSSGAVERREIALSARIEKPSLRLFNGDEFHCIQYLEAGYNGLMFGGTVAVASQMHRIVDLFQAGNLAEARAAEEQVKATLYGIYGGESISCWLTGLKYYMVRKGIFTTTASFLDYPLTEECRNFIDRFVANEAALHDAGRTMSEHL